MLRATGLLLILAARAALAAETAPVIASDSGAQAPERMEAVVVTADRVETPVEDVASSVTVISKKEIRSKQRALVADLLRDVPGLAVSNAGGAGRATSVSIRGLDAGHALVLIDGVEVNDALGTTRGFDFGSLDSQDVERIEVIRGSLSVLYGTQATGGVINIITKKGSQKSAGDFEGEYGTYDSFRIHGSLSGGDSERTYYLGAGRRASAGFPAADKNLGNTLPAGEGLTTVTANVATTSIPRTRLEAGARFSDARFDLAATGGPPGYDTWGNRTGEDPGQKGSSRQLSTRLSARTQASDLWTPSLAASYSVNHRTSDHEPNSMNPTETHATFDSRRARGTLQNELTLFGTNLLAVGFEGGVEKGSSVETHSATGPDVGLKNREDLAGGVYVQDQWLTDVVFATAGARYDAHEHLQSKWTYRFAPGVHVPGTGLSLRASVGTGFKVPTLYQRFSSYGNPGLRPETSLSWDAGVEQRVGPSKLGVTYFHTTLEQMIDYDLVSNHYMNIGKASSEGLELSGRWEPSRRWELSSSYTYLMARDEMTNLALLRRPRHQLMLGADHYFSDRAQVGALARFVGARDDLDAVTSARVQMPAYAVFNLTARYQVAREVRVFGRVDNVFDRQYQEINGFGTPGRSFFLGLGTEI